MGVLDNIISVAVPVAKIAAPLLAELLGVVVSKEANTNGPATIGLIDFIAENGRVLAINNAEEPVGLSFQMENSVEGVSGTESRIISFASRRFDDVTLEIQEFGELGAMSAAPITVTQAPVNAVDPIIVQQLIQWLPLVAVTVFALFGGKVSFTRKTITTPTETTSVWQIGSSSALTQVKMTYGGQDGTQTSFEANLAQSGVSAALDGTYTYIIPMPNPSDVTGPLVNFTVVASAVPAELEKLITRHASLQLDDLLPETKARLNKRAA